MTMVVNEKRFDLIKTYRERQDKLSYYLMGLNVAAIGFTVSKTYEVNLMLYFTQIQM